MLSSSHLQANQKQMNNEGISACVCACIYLCVICKRMKHEKRRHPEGDTAFRKEEKQRNPGDADFDKCTTFTHSDSRLGENDVGGREGMNKLHLTR